MRRISTQKRIYKPFAQKTANLLLTGKCALCGTFAEGFSRRFPFSIVRALEIGQHDFRSGLCGIFWQRRLLGSVNNQGSFFFIDYPGSTQSVNRFGRINQYGVLKPAYNAGSDILIGNILHDDA